MSEQSKLFLLCACVFLGYLTVGLSLGTLPAYIHGTLHFSDLVVGLTIGLQSAATLSVRHFSGVRCDTRGSRSAVVSGGLLSAAAGLAYLLSWRTTAHPVAALSALLAGRILLGFGESLLITGALSWGIGLTGHARSGKVMAWVGIAMYGALACGAPLGNALMAFAGMGSAFFAVFLAPLAGILLVMAVAPVRPSGHIRLPFYRVLSLVGGAGAGLALGTVGLGCLASFITLYFAANHWPGAPLALTVFGTAYILVRLFWGHLPDRLGGSRVAFVSLCIEVAGQLCLWLAPSPAWALAGAALTGVGFSLVFPSFGVVAVSRVAPENKGVALGAYVAFFDLSLGVTGPLAGWLAGHNGYPSIYGLGALAAIAAALLALAQKNNHARSTDRLH